MAWCKNVFQKQFLYWDVSFENPWKRRPFVIDCYHFLILAIFVLLHFVSFYKENYFETYCLMLGSDETGRASWNSPPQGDDILRIVVGPEKVRKNCQFKWYRFNVKQSFKINNGNNMSSISKEKCPHSDTTSHFQKFTALRLSNLTKSKCCLWKWKKGYMFVSSSSLCKFDTFP